MRTTILLPLFLLISNVTWSQDTKKVEGIIRDREQKIVNGILAGDTSSLKAYWAPEFQVNTPRNVIAKDRAAVFQVYRQGLLNYKTFERNIEGIQVHKNMVVTMGYETYSPKVDLPEAKAGEIVKRRFTNVWMKQKGQWMQVARHSSIICQ